MLHLTTAGLKRLVSKQHICLAAYSAAAPAKSRKTVAVVLSGCGVYDGSEVHEACAVLSHLTREGYQTCFFAPDKKQFHVVDHQKGCPVENESRNMLVESARIARRAVNNLSELQPFMVEAVVFPGGFGVAKNLSDFALKGADCTVIPEVRRVIEEFHCAQKPIAMCCIAPVLAARVVECVTITLGQRDDGKGTWPHSSAIDAAKAMGANVELKNVNEVSYDKKNKILSTPAFMYDGMFHEIYDGIGEMIKQLAVIVK